MSRVLIVDDEPSICWGLARLVRALGCRVDTASSAEHGLALAAATRQDLLLLDVRLPGMDGLTAISAFRQHIGDAPIVVMTAFGDLETAVTAVDRGAFDYVVKPFDLKEIRTVIQRALRKTTATASVQSPPAEAAGELIGSTPVMQAVFKRIAFAAKATAPVLLRGESGVGKETAARAIHRHSEQHARPFVAVNLGAMPAEKAELELFGNAVTAGAPPSSSGALAAAAGGTLFLDDVDAVPLPVQAKLQRALDGRDARVTSVQNAAPTATRIIAATRRDLQGLVAAGEFRHDLYGRLAAFEIEMPSLRDRTGDIALLARHFAAQLGGNAAVIDDETIDDLQRRPWNGNVRELRSAIEHALVVARTGPVLPSHFPPPWPSLESGELGAAAPGIESLSAAVASLAKTLLQEAGDRGDVYERFLEEVEPPLLATALLQNGNRCAPAARALGLHRTTLRRKLDQYGIDDAGDR